MAKTGRNDLCHCGSGRKYKKCHGAKQTPAARGRVMLILVGGAVVAAILVGVASFTTQGTGTNRVWSAEHGHYHDANGLEIP
jgi:hypothetical protein